MNHKGKLMRSNFFSLKKALSVLGCCALAWPAWGLNIINGAGSSFVYPVMAQWTAAYHQKTGEAINYQPMGSSGGVNQLKAKTVSFAASDIPMDASALKALKWRQFPVIMGGIVPVLHVPGVAPNQLVLSGATLSAIYLGKLRYWDDPVVQKANPNVHLPHMPIIAVHRSDGSGTDLPRERR